MEMELDLILNWTSSNDIFFVKMTECKGFQNSKNSFQDQIKRSIIKETQKKNKKQNQDQRFFWNQKLNNTKKKL